MVKTLKQILQTKKQMGAKKRKIIGVITANFLEPVLAKPESQYNGFKNTDLGKHKKILITQNPVLIFQIYPKTSFLN